MSLAGERRLDLAVVAALALLAAGLGAVRGVGQAPAGDLAMSALALAGAALAGHLLLRGLGVPRTAAVALPVLFALLGGAPAEMLCVLALWADLMATRARASRGWLWRLVSVPALLVASLSTVAVVPLLLAGELAIWGRLRHREPARTLPARLGAGLSTVAGLAGGLRITAEAVQRTGTPPAGAGHLAAGQLTGLLSSLPQAAAAVQGSLAWWPAAAAAIAAGLALAWYLWRLADPKRSDVGRRRWWLGLAVAGIAVLAGGDGIALAATGQPAVLGAGLAMAALGAAGIVAGVAPAALARRELLSVLAAVLCTAGIASATAAAARSAATYAGEQAMAAQIVRDLPDPPAGSVILVEAGCSDAETGWPDVGRIVSSAYRDPSLSAAVLTGIPSADQDGLRAAVAGGATTRYAYGDLFIYNETRQHVYRMSDPQAANRYVVSERATAACDR
ncbi:MAG: hypothetical protein E6J41_06395 [Chloroflexi bacterium]|nr:MAG: hypothetical protein E6J41_06395 [Chloroflexota bacterium]